MNIDKFVHMGRGLKTLVSSLRQKRARQSVGLRHVLVGLGVLVPSVAVAATYCYENPFLDRGGWTAWFSDETAGWQNLPGLMRGGKFKGSYSDDLSIYWDSLDAAYSLGAESAELTLTDETGGYVNCPANMWVTSIRTSGSFSDNIHFKCREVKKGSTTLRWAPGATVYGPLSDPPTTDNFQCPYGSAVTQMYCAKDYCDDMYFVCMPFRQ